MNTLEKERISVKNNKQMDVRAYYIGDPIPIDIAESRMLVFDAFLIKKEESFLLYKISEDSFLYIKNYGSIVFLNCHSYIIQDVYHG